MGRPSSSPTHCMPPATACDKIRTMTSRNISKYVASRDKDRIFTQELARRGLVDREKRLALVEQTPISAEVKERVRADIASDFASSDKK